MNAFFDVIRQPAFVDFQGSRQEIGKDVLLNGETGDLLGVVSKGYEVVENKEIAILVEEALQDVPVLKTVDHLNSSGNRWVREIILDGDDFTFELETRKGDVLKTKVMITNGYGSNTAVAAEISFWRQVCTNGMMGWNKAHRSSYHHLNRDIIGQMRDDFNRNALEVRSNLGVWESWSETPYSKDRFNHFIDTRTKDNELAIDTAFLTPKIAEGIKGLYDPIMDEYGEDETLWGAYNVLTAIGTHHTKARKGSNIFSQGYGRIGRLTSEFYNDNLSSVRM